MVKGAKAKETAGTEFVVGQPAGKGKAEGAGKSAEDVDLKGVGVVSQPKTQWEKGKGYPSFQAWAEGEFKWNRPVEWKGRDGFTKIDDNRLAKISLEYGHVMDHWDQFKVAIINKNTGLVDQKIFKFGEFMDEVCRDDMAKDSKNSCYRGLWINGNHLSNGISWYISVPRDTGTLVKAVEDYIGMFE